MQGVFFLVETCPPLVRKSSPTILEEKPIKDFKGGNVFEERQNSVSFNLLLN